MQRLYSVAILTAVIAMAGCGGVGSQAGTSLQAPAANLLKGSIRQALSFKYTTVDDPADPTFNEVLGINNGEKLTGFYGNGSPGHFNRGYLVFPPYLQKNFRREDYPSAMDTQVTSVNNKKASAGFFVDMVNNTYGFSLIDGIWNEYKNPAGHGAHPSVTELLGINDSRVGVGFYKNAAGVDRAFEVDMPTGLYHEISPPGSDSAVATGIAGRGDIVGYLTKQGHTMGFLLRKGVYTELAFPGATATKFLGITLFDQIVGAYVDSGGQTHGFMLSNPLRHSIVWQSIDAPKAVGTTVAAGINIHDDIVGYYVDNGGNTHGFLATPRSTL